MRKRERRKRTEKRKMMTTTTMTKGNTGRATKMRASS